MEECEWTKYGRVAGKSIKTEYGKNFDRLNIHVSVTGANNSIRITNYNLYSFLSDYKGNPEVPISIAKGFNEIFNNKSQMRYESYANEDTSSFLYSKGVDPNNGMPINTLPYQHFSKIREISTKQGEMTYKKEVYLHYQKPAFLFQYVASSMHTYFVNRNNGEKERNELGNKLRLVSVSLPPKYNVARNKLIIDTEPLRRNFIYIENPHYLESYYTLTKMINITDFN